MDKRLLFSAILAAGIGATEAQAQKVEAPAFPDPVQLKLDGTDTVYIKNVKAEKWLVNGNAYGTQTSLGDNGMAVAIIPNKTKDKLDGTFTLYNNSADDSFGRKIFTNSFDDNGGNSYVDYKNQAIELCNWEIWTKDGSKRFELQADTIANLKNTTNTRAGWNPNDNGLDGKGEAAADQLFRPALNMKVEGASEYGIEWEAYPVTYFYRVDKLMPAINEALDEGLVIPKAIEAYNNPNASYADLRNAMRYISDVRRNVNLNLGSATAESPVSLNEYITNANCDALDGWNHDCVYDENGNVGSGGHGTNWQAHSSKYTAPDGFETSTFIERWVHASSNPDAGDKQGTGHLSDGYLSQTLTNLPAGAYKISCYAMACQQDKGAGYKVEGVTLFANTNSTQNTKVVATDPASPKKFEFMFEVKEGESVNFGLKLENTTANWLFVDEFQVDYYGTDAQAMFLADMQSVAEEALGTVETAIAYQGYKDAVSELAEAGMDMTESTPKDDIVAQKVKIQDAVTVMNSSAAKYAELEMLKNEIDVFLSEGGNATDELDALYKDCGDGTSLEDLLIVNQTLDNDQIDEYMGKLKAELETSRANSIKAGSDLTYLIKNHTFDNGKDGWTGATVVDANWKNCESYQGTFDMYQEFVAPQEGVYEISAQAMHRVTWNEATATAHENGSEDITAVLYANNMESKFASPFTYGVTESEKADNEYKYTTPDGEEVYIPNSMKGFANACEKNPEAYKTTVTILLKAGETVRMGVRETKRPSANAGDWAIWDNFSMKFLGGDDAAISKVSGPVIEQGTALLDSKMNAEVRATLESALTDLKENGSIKTINAAAEAIAAANTSVDAYQTLGTAVESAQTRFESNEAVYKTSAEAKAVFNAAKASAESAYNDGTVADADVPAAIQALNEAVTKYVIYDNAKLASKDNHVDISNVLVNNDFATMDQTGWTVKKGNIGFQAGNNVEAAEFFNCDFDLKQKIVGLPAGTYYLKSKAFYRTGSNPSAFADEDETVKKYAVNENAFLYFATSDSTFEATEALKPIAACQIAEGNLNEYAHQGSTDGMVKYVEGATSDENLWIPNNMITAQAFFKSEQVGSNYETEPLKIVYDGKSEFYIGAYKDVKVTNDWTIIKNFTLEYAGYDPNEPVTAIKDIENAAGNTTMGTKIYNAAGMLIGKLQRGINVVVTTLSDGSKKVSKIIMK